MEKLEYKILQYPDPILFTRCAEIEEFNLDLRSTARRMMQIVALEGAAGLAANQIGLSIRMFVTDKIAFVNPRILKTSGTQTGTEGCLSEAGKLITKIRPLDVVVEFEDLYGKTKKKAYSGFKARLVLHELDHLDGLYTLEKESK